MKKPDSIIVGNGEGGDDSPDRGTLRGDGRNRPFLPLSERLDLVLVVELACGGPHLLATQPSDRVALLAMMDILGSNVAGRARVEGSSGVPTQLYMGSDISPIPDANGGILCHDAIMHSYGRAVRPSVSEAYWIAASRGWRCFTSDCGFDPALDLAMNRVRHTSAFIATDLFARYTEGAVLRTVVQVELPWGGGSDIDRLGLVCKQKVG